MKTSLVTLFCLFCYFNLFSQEIIGSWKGDLEIQGTKLPLVFTIKQIESRFVTTMDSPMQGAKDIPISETIFIKNELTLSAPNMQLQYKGTLNQNTLEGTFTQGQMNMPFTLTRKKEGEDILNRPQTPQPPFNYNIENVTFTNPVDKNTITGTLTTPSNKKEFPVVVLISGSGQQNRDSELFGHKEFWVIADDFTKKGIGVLRLDDRGIGGSNGATKTMTTLNFAGDISAAVEFLTQKGFAKIGLVGHSEGGIIAPMVASQNNNVKFVIAMAGPGIPCDELLVLQTNALAKAAGASETELKANEESNRKIYALIKNYKGSDLKGELKKIFLEELNKLPKEQQPAAADKEKTIEQESGKIAIPWFTYFLRINPDTYWSKLKIPVLAINGSKDLQVLPKENLAGIKASLEKAKNKHFEIKEFPNLNHLFQEANTGLVEEYGQIEQTISPKVLDVMSIWIGKL